MRIIRFVLSILINLFILGAIIWIIDANVIKFLPKDLTDVFVYIYQPISDFFAGLFDKIHVLLRGK